MKKEITDKDLQECIIEEINAFLAEHRDEIIERARKRLEEKQRANEAKLP